MTNDTSTITADTARSHAKRCGDFGVECGRVLFQRIAAQAAKGGAA